ncbi:hypothetical protein DOTSEDRAFT_75339 [Dothistroma septosporum NZE10]|uniref:Small ribosomal subunit protein mS29 n=1 Tax=Dothistroma septosporum (strain NZE10 / CBS 128990) TaxID=675120 RepID=M2WL01_DOTSN|nr:hypothetical protein DOTSEDRAFT_75339 [Dothistroma septosporum NZE10]
MASSMCLRCLKRSLGGVELSSPNNAIQRAAFTTSSALSAQPVKKKGVVAKPAARTGRTLRLTKNKRAGTTRPPAVGERKSIRKRVVLSNTNALEVAGLQDLPSEYGQIQQAEGKVLGVPNDTVDALRALEAFKPTQGWSLFRRPASLVRKETVELAGDIAWVAENSEGRVVRKVLFGERGSGKSVLQLQALALAQLKKWIVVHIPEAKDLTNAHTSYQPIKTPDGTLYEQPHYTAKLLENLGKANLEVLNKMSVTQQHDLPIQLQPKTSLARLAEIGARDPELAWPIWQALWSELLAPSREGQGLQRPPVMFTCDAVDHVMRLSAYLNAESEPIHAHELTLVQHFVSLLSGKTAMPNGGMILAATSQSNRAAAHTLDHALKRNAQIQTLERMEIDPEQLGKEIKTLRERHEERVADIKQELKEEKIEEHEYHQLLRNERQALQRKLSHLENLAVPGWDPYTSYDKWVQEAMHSVGVQKVEGLSKEEARGVMEFYAHSGMLRSTVTDGLVSEKWTLAGGGIIGQIEHGTVRARF